MPIKAVCPECQTVYQLADQQAGKKVRCKSCQAIFAVEAPSRQTAVRGEGDSSPSRTKSSATSARRDVPTLEAFDEEDERGQSRRGPARSVEKKSSASALLVSAVIGMGLLLMGCAAAITYLVMRDDKPAQVASTSTPAPAVQRAAPPPPPPPPQANPPAVQPAPQADNQPVQGQPVQIPKPDSAKPAQPSPEARAKLETKNEDKEESSGRLTSAGRERVKRATVYLRVKLPDGTQATGSGFFGCKEAPSIILTNAHVVGMLSPDSPRPLEVEVIVNSGEANEWNTKAKVLGVDRASDLAVLDIGTPPQPVPEPLSVKEAGRLHQLDEVYVFGFPFGEALGKEITIRPASVSALRKHSKTGVLEKLQVNGGMDPGNSGGPVVDNRGAVVGVAVSIIPGRQINFAVPGERVHAILSGRIADLMVQQPYFTEGNKVAVPLVLGTIDPRNLIKEVGLELWTGDKPADAKAGNRPESKTQPAAKAGDSSHVYYKLKYMAPEGKAPIVLPELPPNKVYWGQARWINSKGETHWEAAKPLPDLPQPVYRKPAKLELHFTNGAKRSVDLTLENVFKVSDNDDADSVKIRTVAQLGETVASTGSGGGTLLNLRYRFPPSREIILPGGKSIPNGPLEQFKSEMPRYILSLMQLDRLGNITLLSIDNRPLRPLALSNPKQAEQMKEFHEMVQQGLESLSVTMPASGTVNPLESWKVEHNLPIDTPGKAEVGKLDVTFTYQGTRKRDGRDEAVISMDGLVRGKDNAVGGRATGQILVDLASGQTLLAETTMKLQLRALLNKPGEEPRELRVILTMNFTMVRKRMV